VLVALQLQAPPATNLAGCTEVNGKCINHKYVPGTGLLLDLVAMPITDVHMRNGPQVRRQNLLDQRRAIFFSSLQGRTRHAFPSPANELPVSPPPLSIASLRSNTGKTSHEHSIARLSIAIWSWCLKAHCRNRTENIKHTSQCCYDQLNSLF
jgi:hypothetical protein